LPKIHQEEKQQLWVGLRMWFVSSKVTSSQKLEVIQVWWKFEFSSSQVLIDINLEVHCKWQTHRLGIAVIEGEVLIPNVLDWGIHPSSQANSP
jgi:type IV secretory pathway TraG/TraD family ATPase VirD4